ncbi:MFS transporter [Kitasatospora sp. NPDC090091]|uniref:MFS transporter n=1 Tax=Kitasatospora sp. NPDC090091 TaxID=3364081 RepID=UPI0038080115
MIESDRRVPEERPAPLRLTALLATTSAVTGANVYLGQPLLGDAARSLHVPVGTLGALPTATQIGFAAGIALLVPAGDGVDRRRLVLGLCTASALVLAACAMAPTAFWLIAGGLLLGILSPVPQLVAPVAVALAGGHRIGRTLGVVQGGLLVGVLASRTYAGALASVAGWRAVFWCSCAATALLVLVLRRFLPSVPPAAPVAYRTALMSVPKVFAADPRIRRVTLSGALVGISFGAFWTPLTLLLEEGYHYGPATVGLFGLVAAASALVSPLAGRLADRLGWRLAQTVMIGAVLVGWALLLPGETGLGWLIAGVVVLDIGTWSNQVGCQRVLFALRPAMQSRLNACYSTLRFLGIATGSLAGTLAWRYDGWSAVSCVGATACAAALLVAALPHRAPPIAGTPQCPGRSDDLVAEPSGTHAVALYLSPATSRR